MRDRLLRIPALFGAGGYLITAAVFFAPASWRLPPLIVFALCPPLLLTITVDLSAATVFLIMAPVNALLYAAFGLVIALALDSPHL